MRLPKASNAVVTAVVLLLSIPASGLTTPIAGAVALPGNVTLVLPFAAGTRVNLLSGYSPSGGSSLHADTNATNKTNDYYALDMDLPDFANGGRGQPVLAPLAGTVVKAGWATQGWANYGQRVILRHDLGDGHTYHSVYAHLQSLSVTEGDTVSVGTQLGTLGRSCMEALECGSFSAPHLHWVLHRNSNIGGSGTGGSYGGNAVVPEPLDGAQDLSRTRIITSTNSGNPVCGNNVCETGEAGVCLQDCPVCQNIPSSGRVVEDDDICFTRGGSAQYWYEQNVGLGGHLFWTHAVDAAAADNTARWNLGFDVGGRYRVEVYVDATWAQSQQAGYTVRHSGTNERVVVDQAAANGWTTLGVYTFAAGADQYVRLDDNTGEAFSLMRRLVFDAVRVTPEVSPPADAGTAVPDAAVAAADAAVAVDAAPRADAAQSPADAGMDPLDAAGAGDAGSARPDAAQSAGDAGGSMAADAARPVVGADGSTEAPPEEDPGACSAVRDAREGTAWAGLVLLWLAAARARARKN